MGTAVHRSPNKLWRSNSIFMLLRYSVGYRRSLPIYHIWDEPEYELHDEAPPSGHRAHTPAAAMATLCLVFHQKTGKYLF
jgi:hypothetical protein